MKIDFNINAIKNFVEVADIGNITIAAEKLYITQPTLSRHLLSLEEMLNITLFKRVKNGVVLTTEGLVFYNLCKKLLKAYDEFVSGTFEIQNIVAGTLNIAHQKSSEDILIHFNSRFLQEYPNVTIKNFPQSNQNLVEYLMAKELDFAYIYGGELERNYKDIKSIQVGGLKNMLLVSRKNPLSKLDKVHLSQLANERFIFPSKITSPHLATQIVTRCEAVGFTPQVASDADSLVEYLQEIIRYNAVAIIPYMPKMDTVQFKYLELEGYPPCHPIHLAWCETNSNPIVSTYLSFVEQHLADNGSLSSF